MIALTAALVWLADTTSPPVDLGPLVSGLITSVEQIFVASLPILSLLLGGYLVLQIIDGSLGVHFLTTAKASDEKSDGDDGSMWDGEEWDAAMESFNRPRDYQENEPWENF